MFTKTEIFWGLKFWIQRFCTVSANGMKLTGKKGVVTNPVPQKKIDPTQTDTTNSFLILTMLCG